MTLVRGGPAGPNGLGGAYENGVETDRAGLWAALGGQQGVLRGFTHTGVAGQMALTFSPGQALADERDAAGNAGNTLRGYLVWSDVDVTVQFNPASAAARNDAVVAAFVDTEDGPVGTGGLEVGPHLVVVPGVSGTTTPRTDADVNAYIGRGGWVRLMDVPIASTDTQINVANIVVAASAAANTLTQAGRATVTPTGAGANTSVTVTFPRPFAVAPEVTVSFLNGPPIGAGSEMWAWPANVTAAGFDLYVRRSNTSVVPCSWIAAGRPD